MKRKGWQTLPLGEVAKFINGRAFKPSDWISNGLPIIRIQNLTNPSAPFNRYDREVDERYLVEDGDMLVSWSATLDVFIWDRGPAILNQHIFKVVPDSAIVLKQYLFYAFKSIMDVLRAQTHGATMKHITKDPFERTRIPLPPLDEQHRIVRILDEAEALRQLRARADERMAEFIPALFNQMFGDPATNPKGFNLLALGEACLKITDGVHLTPTYVDEGVPFLRVTDIQSAEIDWASVRRILRDEYTEITRRTKPELGDVLYSKNGTIGIAKEITWDNEFAHFVSLALLKPNRTLLDSTYLTEFLNTPMALRQALEHSKTGTVTNLHLNEIRKIRVPCPPPTLQREFVARVAEARALQDQQARSRARLEAGFQALLHRAFNGEL